MAVYSQSSPEGEEPLLKPTLEGISPEQYKEIPGAEITFPEAGSYELRLRGKPKSDNSFKPFQLSYTVNVGKSQVTPSKSAREVASAPGKTTSDSANVFVTQWLIPGVFILLILGLGIIWWRKNLKSKT